MSFANPLGLLALLAIPAAALLWRLAHGRRRRTAVRHPATGTTVASAVARARPPAWRRGLAPTLLALAAAALSVAFARPEKTVSVPVDQASVELVTDSSGSMMSDDVSPTRLQAAQAAARSFLGRVPDKLLVGAVGYSDAVSTSVEPTLDHDQVETAIDRLQADGGTATGDALTAALDRLQERKAADGSTAPAAIVLLSDGKTTTGSDPVAAAARAAKLRIPIYTVALGTQDGTVAAPDGQLVSVPPDPQTLAAIAEKSGGAAFQVSDAGGLDKVYKKLGSRVGTRQEQRDVSASVTAGGLVLLLGGLGTGLRRRGRWV